MPKRKKSSHMHAPNPGDVSTLRGRVDKAQSAQEFSGRAAETKALNVYRQGPARGGIRL